MNTIIVFCIGVVLGYILRGVIRWIKENNEVDSYFNHYEDYPEINDICSEICTADPPRYFGHPIRAEIEPNFEQVWLAENKYRDYLYSKRLSDDDYIKYHRWEDENWEQMYEKHLPTHMVYRGKNEHLIFHGGCLSCQSQQLNGIDRCKGCQYFRANWNLPNLSTNPR